MLYDLLVLLVYYPWILDKLRRLKHLVHLGPNHRLRAQIVPSRRGRGLARADASGGAPKHVSLGWAQRLKRVFGIEIQRCEHCGGTVRIIARIEDPEVIARILAHGEFARIGEVPGAATARGPPSANSELFE